MKIVEFLFYKKENPKAEIDAMVYALYGLSEEEIAIVESSVE